MASIDPHDEIRKIETVTQPPAYEDLLRKEADHWSSVHVDHANPQLWHDGRLFEIFFGREYAMLLDRTDQHGPKVLELGCGEGSLATTLAQRGLTVTALDLSEARLARAQEKADIAGVADRIEFRVADLNRVELAPNAYSCVVAHDSLHHILSLDRLLSKVSDSLVPGGALVVLDYVGMGSFRKLLAAGLFAVLPTFQSYSEKWRLRKRLRGFLSSEKAKRDAMANQDASRLHPESPFEEISQASIVECIEKRFLIQQKLSFLPFWFYLAPKLRLPRSLRYPVARALKTMDNGLLFLGVRGAYCFIDARKHDATAAH
jgi:2-polyprenyl-3-methyl-5-hydroxy-6-metoxy-1,4-benzoquinol methylase